MLWCDRNFNIIYIHSSAPATIFGQLWPGGHRSVLWLLLLSHLLHRLWQLCQCRAKPSTEGGAQGSKRRVGGGKNEIQSCWIFQAYFSGALPLREGSYFPPRGSKSAMAISQVFLWTFSGHIINKIYFSIGRLMSKLLHPGNSWKLLKREAMRLFLLWYAALGEQAGDQVIIAQCLNKNFSPNILKCERRCMQYLQPWCQASPLLTPTWGSLLSQLLPQSQVYYLCSKSFSPKIFLFAFARSEMLSY